MNNKNGWPFKSLNELGFVGRGKSRHRPRNEPSLYGGPYPFIQTAEITASEPYITTYAKTYSEKGLAQSKMWNEDTLCIVNAGENTGETGILKFKACFPDSVIAFVSYPDKSDIIFIKYFLDSIKPQIRKVTKGATQDNLSVETLLSFKIPTPPIETQQKISKIISAFDDLKQNNTRRIAILEQMARMIYQEWFVNFRFPGHEQAKFVESPLGRIPEGWQIKTVGESFEILGGGTPSKEVPEYWQDGNINWYTPSDLTSAGTMFMEESGNKISELGLKKSSARMFPPYSVMMTSRATLGVVSINTTPACTNQGFITCIPNREVPLVCLYFWLKENTRTFINMASGATFKEISKSVFRTIEMVIPPRQVSEKYSQLVEPLTRQLLNLQKRNKTLKQTRDLLLPKLISGQLDVSELNIEV